MELPTLIENYNKAKAMRQKLESKAEEIKATELDLQAQILMALDSAGVQSVKASGFTVSKTHKIVCQIADNIALADTMLTLMQKAKEKGCPAADGLLIQKRAAKEAVVDFIKAELGVPATDDLNIQDANVIQKCQEIGVTLVDNVSLSVRKSSNK